MENINKRIESIRVQRNLTQDQFSKLLRISRAHLGNLETGRREPNAQTIRLLCLEFGVNESWLLTGQGSMLCDCIQENNSDYQELKQLYQSLSPSLRRCALTQLKALADVQSEQEA